MSKELDIQFQKAYKKASDLKQTIAPDVMLRLYAFYKQAIKGDNFSFNAKDVRSAFKLNAWMQLKGMSENEAKKEYINLVNSILNK